MCSQECGSPAENACSPSPVTWPGPAVGGHRAHSACESALGSKIPVFPRIFLSKMFKSVQNALGFLFALDIQSQTPTRNSGKFHAGVLCRHLNKGAFCLILVWSHTVEFITSSTVSCPTAGLDLCLLPLTLVLLVDEDSLKPHPGQRAEPRGESACPWSAVTSRSKHLALRRRVTETGFACPDASGSHVCEMFSNDSPPGDVFLNVKFYSGLFICKESGQ